MEYFTKEEVNKIVTIAVTTTKEKAIAALSTVLESCMNGCDADYIISEFEEELNKEE